MEQEFNPDFSLEFKASENNNGELDTDMDLHFKPHFSSIYLVQIILMMVDQMLISADDVHLLTRALKEFENTGVFPLDTLKAEKAHRDDLWEKARELRNKVFRLEKEAENEVQSDEELTF